MGDDEARARAALAAMQGRITQGPRVILGVGETASPDEVRAAFLQLTKRYHPARFGRMAHDIQRLSNEVFLAIKEAHDQLLKVGVRSTGKMPVISADGSAATRRLTPPGAARSTATMRALDRAPTRPAATRPPTPAATPSAPSPQHRTLTSPLGFSVRPTSSAPTRPLRTADPAGPSSPVARPATPPGDARQSGAFRPQSPPGDARQSGAFRPQSPPGDARQTGAFRPQPPPGFDEHAALNGALALLAARDWPGARHALHALAVRVPQSRHYRALLCYTRGREAHEAGRGDEAILEYQRALQLDPELAVAKQAMAELGRRR